MDYTKLSKFLSYVLRHRPDSIGLVLDENGWAPVDTILTKSPMPVTLQDLIETVRLDEKQRYTLDLENARIRANQGHSIPVDLGLVPSVPPPVLYHGTATRFLESIMVQGLLPMKRQHVHMSSDLDTARIVGSRHGKLVVLEIDTQPLIYTGRKFYLSENGVWLISDIPPNYLRVL